jgi:hypothetical protein
MLVVYASIDPLEATATGRSIESVAVARSKRAKSWKIASYRTHKLAPRRQFFWLPRTDYTHKVRRNPISARQQTRQIQSVS